MNFKVIFSLFIFLNMDISPNTCFPGITFFMIVHNIIFEGSVPQIFDLGPSFYLCTKITTKLRPKSKWPSCNCIQKFKYF